MHFVVIEECVLVFTYMDFYANCEEVRNINDLLSQEETLSHDHIQIYVSKILILCNNIPVV